MGRQCWRLKRNCSLSPRQAGLAYGALCLFTLLIGMGFALIGMWMMLVFAAINICAVVLALLQYARHACDSEEIVLEPGCLRIDRCEAGRLRSVLLDPGWTRVAEARRRPSLIHLESRGVQVDIGGFVSDAIRQRVALELRRALRRHALIR